MPQENTLHVVSGAQDGKIPSLPTAGQQTSPSASVKVTLEHTIDLALLRRQKRALHGITEGATVSYEQEDAAEGMLNLLNFIQDAILEQGLATEEDIFPRLPQLFDQESPGIDVAA